MPTMDEGSIIDQLTKLPSIDLDQSVQGDMAAQRALMRVPEVQDVIARVGSDEIGLDPMSPNETDSFLRLKPRSEWRGEKDLIVMDLRQAMAGLPGIEPSFTQPIEMPLSDLLDGSHCERSYKLLRTGLGALCTLEEQAHEILLNVRG